MAALGSVYFLVAFSLMRATIVLYSAVPVHLDSPKPTQTGHLVTAAARYPDMMRLRVNLLSSANADPPPTRPKRATPHPSPAHFRLPCLCPPDPSISAHPPTASPSPPPPLDSLHCGLQSFTLWMCTENRLIGVEN
ncbi:hypothetical protein R3P38DRAFT_3222958 [Favolaschia claudopus]|uniref:Uncharacterized protein n=1 Tax=Favolaschia claudopus TaxID=2862362 RepID=A0AAV9ZZ76_9AGAR